MNQAQRNFLTDKIEESTKVQVRSLRELLPDHPNLSNFLLHKIMSGDFDIKSKEELKRQITERAISAKDGKDWNLSGRSSHWETQRAIEFKFKDFFVIDQEFQDKIDEYTQESQRINKEINDIQSRSDTLVVRIKLASNSTLESMIKEVDDMGNIQLMDTKLKAISN